MNLGKSTSQVCFWLSNKAEEVLVRVWLAQDGERPIVVVQLCLPIMVVGVDLVMGSWMNLVRRSLVVGTRVAVVEEYHKDYRKVSQERQQGCSVGVPMDPLSNHSIQLDEVWVALGEVVLLNMEEKQEIEQDAVRG